MVEAKRGEGMATSKRNKHASYYDEVQDFNSSFGMSKDEAKALISSFGIDFKKPKKEVPANLQEENIVPSPEMLKKVAEMLSSGADFVDIQIEVKKKYKKRMPLGQIKALSELMEV
jgi:hypothetical protein